jgi:hypothetical protein
MFINRMEVNCEINKGKHADYPMFIAPAVQHITNTYARFSGRTVDLGACERTEWSGTVTLKYWKALVVLHRAMLKARGLRNVTAPGVIAEGRQMRKPPARLRERFAPSWRKAIVASLKASPLPYSRNPSLRIFCRSLVLDAPVNPKTSHITNMARTA